MKRLITVAIVLVLVTMLAPATVSAQGQGETYIVQSGDSLVKIAARYGVSVNSLAAINGITNPALVYVGQRLVIPAAGSSLPMPSRPSSDAGTHVVSAGENLYRIALRYGLTTADLAAANSISNYDSIRAGQILRIPGRSTAPGLPAPGWTGGKRIQISISRQHLWAYSGNQLVFSFVASTGLAKSPTMPGHFKVRSKIPNAYASTWNLQMPYWLGIYQVGSLENGIHALPILSNGQKLWAGLLGRPASFGCVILDTAAARQLYNWAEIGTPVVIDP